MAAAGLAWVGLIHSYRPAIADTVVYIGWGAGASWAIGYFLLAGLLGFVAWFRGAMVTKKV